jgi:DsbC/DsbD-like thiol-disulfide interchange protein
MKKFRWTTRLIGLCLLSFLAHAQTEKPIQWSLQVAPKTFVAGGTFTAQLTARIAPGWHLYALEEIPNGPRPTRITLAAKQPFQLSGEIHAPAPRVKFDENFGVETQVYEQAVTFGVPIKIAAAKSGRTTLTVQTRFQVCNERICLPPKTMTVAAALKIKGSGKNRREYGTNGNNGRHGNFAVRPFFSVCSVISVCSVFLLSPT